MRQLLDLLLNHRTQLMAVVLIICLLAPQPAHAQFGLGGLISAIGGIGSAILNVIAPALQQQNGLLSTLNNVLNAVNAFFQNVIYPKSAIARAQGLVGALGGLYATIQATSTVNVASATLPVPQTFEGLVLSRNPMNIPTITTQFQSLYQTVPAATDASPEQRNMMDMTDAASQDAFKRSVAIDATAATEMQAA